MIARDTKPLNSSASNVRHQGGTGKAPSARREEATVIGETLLHYRITAKLGAGGMGEVYRAEDTKLGRDVAIKALPAGMTDAPERLSRFRREAQLLASLNHPHIASIHGVEESEGRLFLVLELVEGDDLSERLKRGPLPVEEALAIARQVAEALEEAHEKGVIHRDLKPANIKVTSDGNVKVLDFGLAKALAADESQPDHSHSPTFSLAATREGVLLGTAAYMSPEQAKGLAVDKRTDIFSFGCVLYELLTGRKAFQGDVVSEILASVLAREPDLGLVPTRLHPRLKELLHRSLEKDPKKRWQAVGDLRVEIEAVLADPRGVRVADLGGARPGLTRRAHALWALTSVAAIVLTAFVARGLAPTPERSVKRFVFDTGAPLGRENPGSMVALSSDGSQLAYLAMEEGRQILYLRPMSAFESTVIPETTGAYAPFFSSDGQWLAFFSGNTLKKVQLPTGRPLSVVEVGAAQAGGTWGPDDAIVLGLREEGLGRVSSSGGEIESLTSVDTEAGETEHDWPTWLPGGEAVVFTIIHGDNLRNARLAVLSLATGERRILLDEEGYAPRYVATGHLVYGRAGIVMAVPFDLRTLAVAGNPVQMLDGVETKPKGAQSIAVSGDGSLVYVPGGSTVNERFLVWVDRNGQVTPVDGAPPRDYKMPRLSPDGRQVALEVQGVESDIFVFDLERGTLTGLTTAASGIQRPAWTRDGERLSFVSREGHIQWRAADGSGSTETLLERDGRQYPAAWSPDGSALAFYEDGDSLDIWLLKDGAVTPYLATGANQRPQTFSPDGRYLAYTSDESGQNEVYVRTFPDPDGGRWQISTGGGTEPVWSRDGELFYRRGATMIAVRVQTEPELALGAQAELFSGTFSAIHDTAAYDYDPGADRFLMLSALGGDETSLTPIHLVLNWDEELKRRAPARR
jgi:serine/threonine-protein kinase